MSAEKQRILGMWWPSFLFSGILLILLLMFIPGGTSRIIAWYLILCLPLIGVCYVIAGLIRLLWVRRFSRSLVISLLIGILALIPITWIPVFQIWPQAFPMNVDATEPRLAIRVPTDQIMQVSNGGNDPSRNVHAFLPPQRWAYDLVIAPYPYGSQVLTDYGCYEEPVVAPVSGDVVQVANDVPDSVPGVVDVSANAYGNHVVVKPEQGGFLIVAHMQPGSIAVEEGEKVIEGQMIGRCGNSGNTTAPHVHVHYQAQDPGTTELLTQGLPLFFRDNEGPAMPNGGQRFENGEIVYYGDVIRHAPTN